MSSLVTSAYSPVVSAARGRRPSQRGTGRLVITVLRQAPRTAVTGPATNWRASMACAPMSMMAPPPDSASERSSSGSKGDARYHERSSSNRASSRAPRRPSHGRPIHRECWDGSPSRGTDRPPARFTPPVGATWQGARISRAGGRKNTTSQVSAIATCSVRRLEADLLCPTNACQMPEPARAPRPLSPEPTNSLCRSRRSTPERHARGALTTREGPSQSLPYQAVATGRCRLSAR